MLSNPAVSSSCCRKTRVFMVGHPFRRLLRNFIHDTCKKHIRILHECEGGIEKSVTRITDWHHEACRVMTKGDHEGRIFLSHPQMNNGFFFLLTTKYLILFWKNLKKTSRKSWIRWDATWWRHFNILVTSRIDVQPAWGCSFFLSFSRAGTGVWERNFSHG